LLCRAGLHKWTPWHSINVPLVPVGDHNALRTILSYNVSLETKVRTCKRHGCDESNVKKVLHW
jgi:hypothetical protein